MTGRLGKSEALLSKSGKSEYVPMKCKCCNRCKGLKMPNGLPVCIYGGPFEGYYNPTLSEGEQSDDFDEGQTHDSDETPGWRSREDTNGGVSHGPVSVPPLDVSTHACEDLYYKDLQSKR